MFCCYCFYQLPITSKKEKHGNKHDGLVLNKGYCWNPPSLRTQTYFWSSLPSIRVYRLPSFLPIPTFRLSNKLLTRHACTSCMQSVYSGYYTIRNLKCSSSSLSSNRLSHHWLSRKKSSFKFSLLFRWSK